MRKLVYYVAVSLDGRIAGPGGEYDFYPAGDEQQGAAYTAWTAALYPETVPTAHRAAAGLTDAPGRHFDTIVMGLGAYRPALDHGITSPYAHLRQYVVSSTLKPDIDPAVTVVPGDPLALVRDLKREQGTGLGIWLCGGGKLAGALLPEIDELVIKSYPVVAGAGIPAFDGAFDPTVFDVAERTAFPNGVTLTHLIRRQADHAPGRKADQAVA
ncbi:dihydrofolate reductase family protein [Streptomyces bluensis]|uniref:Dihydrofolate reductase family protein n=1 Tax=Streptomyces bluensis TaxID=33897 RepID=A0ABW6UKP2_9ACTN